MIAGRDIDVSARLAATEWWLPLEMAAGVVGYAVWVAGTGTLLSSIAASLALPVGRDGGPGTLAAVAVLWLALPGVVAAWRVHGRLTNIRENLAAPYRLDHPADLLVPPYVLVVLLVGGGLALDFPTPLLAVLFPAGLYLLVRTIAYSYRVYTLSYPSVTLWLVAVAVAIEAVSLLVGMRPLLGRVRVVDAALSTAGVEATLSGDVGALGVSAPAWLAVGTAAPIVLSIGYLLSQSVAAAIAHVIEPRWSKRADQRYPPWFDANAARARSTRVASTGGTDGSGADTGDATGTDDDGDADGSEADEDDEDIDDVSHTKVFTPPGGEDGDVPGPSSGGAADADPTVVATEDERGGPHSDADARQRHDEQRCLSCGDAFDVEVDRNFCPTCGDPLA